MENNLEFKNYLISKKIDPSKFILAEEQEYKKLEHAFNQMHPDSFSAQKIFLINPLRRKFLLIEDLKEKIPTPKIKFKLK